MNWLLCVLSILLAYAVMTRIASVEARRIVAEVAEAAKQKPATRAKELMTVKTEDFGNLTPDLTVCASLRDDGGIVLQGTKTVHQIPARNMLKAWEAAALLNCMAQPHQPENYSRKLVDRFAPKGK